MFVAYRFKSITGEYDSDEIDKNISGVWAQITPDKSEPTFYTAILCTDIDIFSASKTSKQF